MDSLFEYLASLSDSTAYFIIFGILVACGLGFPLPEDIPLVASGYLCWDGTMNIGLAFLTTMAGVGIGDSILYFIGRRLGPTILDNERLPLLKPEKVRRTRAYFRKYGQKIVFFARFVAGFRAAAFFIAGAMRMKYSRFILLDMLAALLSVPIWIALGYALGHYLGSEIGAILEKVKHLKMYFTIAVGIAVAVIVLRIYLQYRKAKALQAAKRTS